MIEYLLIGIIIGFIFYELTGLSAGGIITPGYFAIYIYQPLSIFYSVLIAVLVWILLNILQKYLILYGKRKFLLGILLGISLKYILQLILSLPVIPDIEFASIGFVIPGLIGHEMNRQGFFKTLLSTGCVTIISYMVILLIK